MTAGWNARAHSAAPPARVWDVLLDGRRWSFWNPGVEWMWIEGEPAPGTIVTVKLRKVRQTALRLSDIVPGRRLALELTFGPAIRYVVTWTLERSDGGTAIACDMTLDGFAGGLLRRSAERIGAAMPGFVERLAAYAAESGVTGSA